MRTDLSAGTVYIAPRSTLSRVLHQSESLGVASGFVLRYCKDLICPGMVRETVRCAWNGTLVLSHPDVAEAVGWG